ncbi:MAG: c-type cytochrome biogenesis protein CcmI [Pseudomonadota bacterium]
MLLWVGLALLTAAAITLVLRPITSDGGPVRDASSADIAVYKDQLAEIDTDLDRGLINAKEAEAARAELARRLLSRQDPSSARDDANIDAEPASGLGLGVSREALGLVMGLLLPVLAVSMYLSIGSPHLPAQTHAARIQVAPENASAEALIAKVEAKLRKNPEDGRGWEVLGPVYRQFERYDDAANAYAQAIRLLGETPERLKGFAQAEIVAKNGLVSPRARLAYDRLLKLEPNSTQALYWLAQAKEQDGNLTGALAQYRTLLASAPEDAAWKTSVEERIAALSGLDAKKTASKDGKAQSSGANGTKDGSPGPTSDDVAAAADLTAEQRGQFIDQMVTRLADRLKENGNDAGGWKRLIRAYMVLGRTDDARKALREARRNFARSEDIQTEFDVFAKGLGLGS